MGIQSNFGYGIKLYNYSFAFSNLKINEDMDDEIVNKSNNSYRFLASISKELFSNLSLKKRNVNANLKNNWVFTCI